MLGEGLARRPAALEPLDLGTRLHRRLDREVVFRGPRGELVEFELQLTEKTLLALRAPPVERAPQLLDHQRQGRDLGLRLRGLGLGRRRPRLRSGQRRLQRLDLSSGAVDVLVHSAGRGAAVHVPHSKAIRLAP